MNFEDKLQVQLKIYNVGYVQIGGVFYDMKDSGEPDFDVKNENAGSGYDAQGNPIEATATRFLDFGKCLIFPNTKASLITLNDGSKYQYAYEVIAPLSKQKYKMLPTEGDKVKITKKDGTIEKEMEVKGFVNLKRRYLKLYLYNAMYDNR